MNPINMIKKAKQKTYDALRWSEKYTKTDMVYLAKGGGLLTSGQTVTAIIGFLLAIAFANLIPKEVYGTYRFILSTAAIIGSFSLTGLGTSLIKTVASGGEGVVKKVFWINLRWSLIPSVLSFGTAAYYFFQGNSLLGISLMIVALFIPITQSASLYSAFLIGKRNFLKNTSYNVAFSAITSATIFITLLLTDSPIFIILASFASQALVMAVLYFLVTKDIPETQTSEKDTIQYGKHLSAMNIIGTIANQIDKILLFHFLGPVQLATYSIATSTSERIGGILKNIRLLALPKFAQHSKEVIQKTLWQKTKSFLIVVVPLTIIYVLLVPPFFRILFPAYLDSIPFAQALGISILLMGASFPGIFLESHRAIKQKYQLKTTTSVVRIGLLLILVVPYGVWGVVFAVLLSQLVNALLSFWLAYRV